MHLSVRLQVADQIWSVILQITKPPTTEPPSVPATTPAPAVTREQPDVAAEKMDTAEPELIEGLPQAQPYSEQAGTSEYTLLIEGLPIAALLGTGRHH